jgi:hypothetical protein
MLSEILETNRPVIGFVHIAKTAGTTVKFILRNSTFFRHCDVQPLARRGIFTDQDYRFMKKFFPRLCSLAGHSLIHPTAHLSAPIQYFTFLRDPFERCLSHYQHIKRAYQRQNRNFSFESFMQDTFMRDYQVRHIAGAPDLEKAKELLSRYLFVGITERFAESMYVFQKLCPYSLNVQYNRLHVTRDKTAAQKVRKEAASRRLLEESNQLDLQLYTFARDTLYPALRKKAGLEPLESDEKDLLPQTYPLRYKCTRSYNLAVYRSMNKLRRRLVTRSPAHTVL